MKKAMHQRLVKVLFLLPALLVIYQVFAQSDPWGAPAPAQGVKNPLNPTPASLKEGKALYASYCTPCHGNRGKGDGPGSAALNPKPADHTSAKVQKETDGSLFWKISEGHNAMPKWKNVLTETQRWELVNYIRTLSATERK